MVNVSLDEDDPLARVDLTGCGYGREVTITITVIFNDPK